ncbi:peptidase T [Alkaliphilus peptidifermentans]|uniref:Peptidase T n=1 Tax=Alkaliphilus peptidifermentans DSM 18978 TaxID=1120976 RepID=A0A1G5KNU0_9FIRM|nr:peptidase T [Alkaliphilus peptidifermentans]SCZ02267.1 tripeptide aminopeptidase [Alkaliphilus peptidifermentans DSM 18978]
MEKVVERFLKYVKLDTKANPQSETCPSTNNQYTFGEGLVEELKDIGLIDAAIDENGYVMATLPANTEEHKPIIGFIAHMDTSPDMSGENVKPQLIENYNGGDILLNKDQNITLSPSDFPDLSNYIGETIITTDGTTLLGADNKAGIAEIITAIEFLIQNPELKHGTIKIAFTPDEEIGRGADFFDVKKFGAQYGYTVDGGPIGELEYETFNAAGCKIKVQGRNVHPGSAKNKMINSMLIAMELNASLPANERPEYTENYEGFFHLVSINGDVEETSLEYIIRDHSRELFEKKKKIIEEAVAFLNLKYGEGTIVLQLKDQYYNMKEKIVPFMEIVDKAGLAMEAVGVTPLITPVRGGTDGARLSYMGLPCPNIFTGGHNFHGKYEYIPVNSMKKAVEVIVKIATE